MTNSTPLPTLVRINTPAGTLYVNPARVIAVSDLADPATNKPIVGSCGLICDGGVSLPLMGVSKDAAAALLQGKPAPTYPRLADPREN